MKKEDAASPLREPVRPVEPGKARKKPYRAPTLTEYGPVQRLTQSGGSVSLADGSQAMRMPCL
jgi:hypothetical protein